MTPSIDVRRYGQTGPSVTVLHGGPGAPGSVAALADALADGFQVAEPLQRRAGGAPLTVAGHVADLAEVVTEPTHVVGWSWGAMLGLSFATAHPGSVRSLVLIGCGTYDEASRAEYTRRMAERLDAGGRKQMDSVREKLARATSRAEADHLLAVRGTLAGRAQAYAPIVVDSFHPPADTLGHEETWADVVRLQADGIEPAAFAAIRAPVLMLHGDTDPHPGPATRDVLRRSIPQLEYVELAQCGHTPWLEQHARFPFLSELRTWLHTH